MNSLDPHKGSVTDGREGVCMDPGEKDAILGTGRPTPPGKGEGQQLVPDSGEERRSSMTTETGDGLATTSRNGYEQSECHCALYSNCVVYL